MNTTTEIKRARCTGHPGYRNGRAHLVSLDRLIDPRSDELFAVVRATGPCPVCGASGVVAAGDGPAGRMQIYQLVGIKGTYMPNRKCRAACLQSASAECKCSCGGADHGMHA